MGTSPKTGEEFERKQKLSLYFRGTSEAKGVNTPRSDTGVTPDLGLDFDDRICHDGR